MSVCGFTVIIDSTQKMALKDVNASYAEHMALLCHVYFEGNIEKIYNIE